MADTDTDLDGPPWAEAPQDEPAARDENTDDMFGGPPATEVEATAPLSAPTLTSAGDSPAYTVIARKYRPRRFEDLIGQEAMVRTLTNAFASGRIAHAFMLTGVRGVGKTTTARLLARALNYESATVHQPSVDLSVEGYHCRAIIEGRQMDVLELDAASRTKVDEMRELLDGARYAPVETRFKVYVIDEVHMLSTAAFNALLKTLEEPPPHVKFIFATTEIRKVPVTILSRCQRFDLRRVEPEVIAANLKSISETEGARVEGEALSLIARAAEGSVRDAQSLLDQAIVQAEPGQPVSAASVRDMLGLADRTQTIALFEQVMKGQTADALAAFRTLYGFGAAPDLVMLDLLEHSHAASVAKALGPDALHLPSDQAQRLTAVGAVASAGTLSRVWSMLLKSHDEVRRAPDPFAAVEMALIRLCYAADLPGPEEALRRIQSGEVSVAPAIEAPAPPPSGGVRASAGGGASATYAQPQSSLRPVAAPDAHGLLQSFEDVVKLIETKRDALLKVDVDRFVRLVDFKPGVITFAPAPGAPANLHQRLSSRLKEWTGQPWRMVIEGGGGLETAHEREQKEARAFRDEAENDPMVQALLTAFPGAEVIGVRRLAPQTVDTLDLETGPNGDDDNDD